MGSQTSRCQVHDQPAIQSFSLRWRRTLDDMGYGLTCETGHPYPDECRMVSTDPHTVVGLALLSQFKQDAVTPPEDTDG